MQVSELQARGLGRGIYAVSEAAQLTGVRPSRIRRWFRGYEYRYKGETRTSPPAVRGDYPPGRQLQLSFFDMTEMRVIDAFLRFGVGWGEVRRAAEVAVE